jgi:Ubiquitin family
MQIFVKGLEGKTMAFDVTPTMKISELKSLVRNTGGLPEDVYIRLVFVSRELSDEASTLADYNI